MEQTLDHLLIRKLGNVDFSVDHEFHRHGINLFQNRDEILGFVGQDVVLDMLLDLLQLAKVHDTN